MMNYKFVIVLVLVSMVALSRSEDEVEIVKPDPCAIDRCDSASLTCIIATKGCNKGEEYCAKCLDCGELKCRGGCKVVSEDDKCPVCSCPPIDLNAKEKY